MDLIEQIEQLTGQPLRVALEHTPQSVQCPVKKEMKMSLSTMISHIAGNQRGKLLSSRAIWACTGCRRCQNLLGNDVDFSKVIDALRRIALDEGHRTEPEAVFYEKFLDNIKRRGRLGEFKILGPYIRKTARGGLAAAMFFKRKLRLRSTKPKRWKPF